MKRTSLEPSQMSQLSRYTTYRSTHSSHLITRLFKARLSETFICPSHICSVPLHCVSVQIYSTRDLEDNLNKIREICSDDKHDWDQRANAVSIFTFNTSFMYYYNDLFWDCFIWSLLVSVMFFNRWRRSAHCWWRAQPATTVSTSIYGSWMEPSNCRLKTCAHKWSERPASPWRECWWLILLLAWCAVRGNLYHPGL